MSTNIKIQKVCIRCGADFIAQKTSTQYCSHVCSRRAYKERERAVIVEKINNETQRIKTKPIETINAKEFLTVREVAILLNCSVRTAYYYIESGIIKAVSLSQRVTRVKRSDIDKLFEQPQPIKSSKPVSEPESANYEIADCYKIPEIHKKYGISEKAIYDLIKRKNIPKFKKGWYAYVPKVEIDKLLIQPKTLFD